MPSVTEHAKAYMTAYKKYKEQKAIATELSKAAEVEKMKLVHSMTDDEVGNIGIEGLGLASLTKTPRVAITDADKFRDALLDAGLKHLLTMNSRTLQAFYKDGAEAHWPDVHDDPAALGLSVTEQANISVRFE